MIACMLHRIIIWQGAQTLPLQPMMKKRWLLFTLARCAQTISFSHIAHELVRLRYRTWHVRETKTKKTQLTSKLKSWTAGSDPASTPTKKVSVTKNWILAFCMHDTVASYLQTTHTHENKGPWLACPHNMHYVCWELGYARLGSILQYS